LLLVLYLQWLEYFLAYCGALAFEGDPIEWSKNHRWHHQNSDSPADRHSPRDGLWHAHMGWLFDESLTNTRCAACVCICGLCGVLARQ
jgi:stearoyl-CoA desaturase (delta-9 desaturase)